MSEQTDGLAAAREAVLQAARWHFLHASIASPEHHERHTPDACPLLIHALDRLIAQTAVVTLTEVERGLWGGENYPGTTWRHEAVRRMIDQARADVAALEGAER